ncbi:MAG: hypothetical protein DRP02_10930 [Candidatus Gerdarchaeota archaeon]|nr:MAG: hypothetical protein DRP02_10930 [Candidatus Gerdarchaeota archaeon]
MAEKKTNIPQITIAEVLKLDHEKSVELPSSFQEALQAVVEEYAVVILTTNNKIIRIIPTSSNKVYKLAVDIGQLSSDFLRQIGNLFLKLGLKALYSTGICFVEEKCVFDGYIEATEFKKINIEDLKKELSSIEGVSGITITVLEVC